MPAPIALFVYNRPLHTQRTVEALLANAPAARSDLFVFADAARSPAAAPAVADVRSYVRGIRGFRSVSVIERETNFGLARSIIDGVTRLCGERGRAIVLEDDLVTSPHFLGYMNDALDLYADRSEVMHVSGCAYPVDLTAEADSYFLRVPLCWGWATWDRAWASFRKDLGVMQRFDRRMISRFNFDGTYDYWKQLEQNRDGAIDTWFVFWYATVFLQDGLVLFPRRSLVRNIGMDGTGVHCGSTTDFDTEVSADPVELTAVPLVESRAAYADHKRYFRRLAPPLHARAMRKLARIVREFHAR